MASLPLRISLLAGNQVKITTTAEAGKTYTLEASGDLKTWEALGTPQAPPADTVLEWLFPQTGSQRYFRIEAQ